MHLSPWNAIGITLHTSQSRQNFDSLIPYVIGQKVNSWSKGWRVTVSDRNSNHCLLLKQTTTSSIFLTSLAGQSWLSDLKQTLCWLIGLYKDYQIGIRRTTVHYMLSCHDLHFQCSNTGWVVNGDLFQAAHCPAGSTNSVIVPQPVPN